MEDFKVGDEVEFEICDDDKPRHNWDDDYVMLGLRSSFFPPKYITGKVVYLCEPTISHPNGSFMVDFGRNDAWQWPQPSNNQFIYDKQGYLRRISKNNISFAGVKNNDGRDTCYVCGAKTRSCGGWSFNHDYRICTKCGK